MNSIVVKVHLTKRWREPGSAGVQEVDVEDQASIQRVQEFLTPGDRVEYHVRSPFTPTYYIRQQDSVGAIVDEVRVVGGGIIVQDQGSFKVREPGLREFLDQLIQECLAKRKG